MLRDSGQSMNAEEVIPLLPEASEGHGNLAVEANAVMPSLAATLAELQVRRLFYIRAINRQILAAKALLRRAIGWRPDDAESEKVNKRAGRIVDRALAGKDQDAEDLAIAGALAADLAVIAQTIGPMQRARQEVEKAMKKAAKELPVYGWAKEVRGLGELGLAVIIAEAGDLSKYPTKGHLWKRLGLAPHAGKAASSWRRDGGLSAEEWTTLGYKPTRRAELHAVIADPLFRQQSVCAGPYRAVYDRRRAASALTHPDWTKAHSHADGLRVMTKYLLRDLWVAHRRSTEDVSIRTEVPVTADALLPGGVA